MEFSITNIIIGITVLISLYAFSQHTVLRNMMMNPYLVESKNQYYRFLTSGFIHGDMMHLLFNMFSLYFFGSVVEITFEQIFENGSLYFIMFYLLGIVVSDIPSYFKNRRNPAYNALGASGGVSAVIFAAIVFQPLQYICIYLFICLPGFILGALYLIWSYYQGKRGGDNINHDAHMYGALFGVLFCVVMYPISIKSFFQQIASWDITEYFDFFR
jgi:membrane associated rhomboid family serine protease